MDIKKIKELKANATQGEWSVEHDGNYIAAINEGDGDWDWVVIGEGNCLSKCEKDRKEEAERIGVAFEPHGVVNKNDAKFIAALPEIAQLAIDQAEEIERLNKIIDEMVGDV